MSELKYKVGDSVRIKSIDWYNQMLAIKDKQAYRTTSNGCEFIGIWCANRIFKNDMIKFCGQVMTIKAIENEYYVMHEDTSGYWYCDEMFEGLVEEETKTEIKFKVGDKITNGKATLTILTLSPDKYVVEDNFGECGILYFNSQDGWKIVEEETQPKFKIGDKVITNKGYIGRFEGWVSDYQVRVLFEESGCNVVIHPKDLKLVEEEIKPKYEDEVNGEYYSTPKYLVRPSGYQFVDENGNVINAQKIVLEKLVVPKFKKGDKIKDKNNRVWYVEQVGKKHFDISRIPNGGSGYFVPIEDQDYYELVPDIELPKTFEECVSVLMREGGNRMPLEQMNTFRKLIDARNAYWTIYGKENGLGEPWEPDWNDEKQDKYGFYDEVKYTIINPAIFVFPTEEMRDAFKENFDPDIEICKKFL